jgi:hypothetical protein
MSPEEGANVPSWTVSDFVTFERLNIFEYMAITSEP